MVLQPLARPTMQLWWWTTVYIVPPEVRTNTVGGRDKERHQVEKSGRRVVHPGRNNDQNDQNAKNAASRVTSREFARVR